MALSNNEKIEAIKFAKEYHQNYYELLPDWFQYDFENYELIRHKIGYALFGLPKIDIDTEISNISINCTNDNNQSEYIYKKIIYDKTMCKIINTIYEKIIKYGKDNNNSSIYIGIIFNIIFLQTKVSQKSNEKDNALSKENNNICILPIFKLKTLQYDTWYIDNEGRIYKTWKDYISNNTLPPCTMILPKNGLYQCNPNYKVTEYFSSVWIEILDSPACTFKNKVLKGIDVAVNTMSIITGIGLSAASFLTPIGPTILTTGLIHGGICGTWIIVRNSQKLIDLATHKQSINPINKNAFSAWFEVSSAALTLGANSGTMLISKALSRGCTISAAAKVAYNSVILSNLTVNGASVIYQGYRLIEKYKMEKNVDLLDIAIFTSQILFFSNTLIKTKLANELIVSSKGTILEKLKNILRVNRLKQEFNKIKAYSSKDVENKSESIIYKIKEFSNKEDFLNSLSKMNWKNKFLIKYQNGNIVINNKIFIHPIHFMTHLLTIGAVTFNLIDPHSSIVSKERNYIMINLKILVKQLLKNFYAEKEYSDEAIPDVNYFNEILQEIKYMDNAVDVLKKCFKIAVIIIEHCNDPRQFLCDAVYFSWIYCKGNLKEYGINIDTTSKNKIFNELARIVEFLYECIEVIANELFSAFYAYISTTKPEINNYIMLNDN